MSTGRGGLSGGAAHGADPADRGRGPGEPTAGALPVNACGGIFTAADALACLDAGATTVQIYTGLIYRGTRPWSASSSPGCARAGMTSPSGP